MIRSFWCLLSSPPLSMDHSQLERVDSAPLVYEEEIESKKQKTVAIIKEKIYLFGVKSRVKEGGLPFLSVIRVAM